MQDIRGGMRMNDQIEKLGSSTIHHGKLNDRIYLMKLDRNDRVHIISMIEALAKKHNYSKIIAKIPASFSPLFISESYICEANIPGFFKGKEDAYFMSKFLAPERKEKPLKNILKFSDLLNSKEEDESQDQLFPDFKIERLNERSAKEITNLFHEVFKTYPFPIHSQEYILKTMQSGDLKYFGVRHQDKLIGLSSAEMDKKNLNAEMTDFAVLPEYRGHSLAHHLLREMEKDMMKTGFRTLYTIARLNSPGMNKTFLKNQYHFSGILINNTNISGKIESMNVYYKQISL